jgi:hypothetical protein
MARAGIPSPCVALGIGLGEIFWRGRSRLARAMVGAARTNAKPASFMVGDEELRGKVEI